MFCQVLSSTGDTRLSKLGNSLVLHWPSLLRTIFASSACAHEHVHVQNVRDFPQTKLHNRINSPFLLNEHGDPQFFFRYLYEKRKKSLIVEHDLFFGKWFPTGCIWPRRLQVNHGTVWKSPISLQPGNQERLKWSNTAQVNKWSFTFKTKFCAFPVTKI